VLRSYVQRLGEIATSTNDREHKRSLAETRIEEIRVERERITADHGSVDDQLDKSLAGEYAGVQASTFAPTPADLAWVPRADDPRAKTKQASDEEDALRKKELAEQTRSRRRGIGIVSAGSVLLGAGIAGFAVMGVGASKAARANDFDPAQTPDQRREQIGEGRTGNALAVAGLVSGGVLLVSGVVLVAIGARRMKKNPGAHARVSPTPGGVLITGRF
jgi:hypothetical protein